MFLHLAHTAPAPAVHCAAVRTLVDMEGSYLSANFFREIVAAESFSYDPSRPKPQFVTLNGEQGGASGCGAAAAGIRAWLPGVPGMSGQTQTATQGIQEAWHSFIGMWKNVLLV
eukprot:GHRQ01017373.1.p2 GENE.GHRQ01017373.1~~GHRQ01017373.1.p2  ORF type:complete len:114 (-),score=27.90 GHRQ01017373.1:127-468(-)